METDKGETLVNLVCTAKICGLNKFETRAGRTTETIRWARVKDKLKSIYYILDEKDKALNESFSVNGTMGIPINANGLYSLN